MLGGMVTMPGEAGNRGSRWLPRRAGSVTIRRVHGRVRWSWAASAEEAETWRTEARALVGRHIERIRYFEIDYGAELYRRDVVGPRAIESEEEWANAPWSQSVCDSVDHAVELETSDGAFFTVSWDPPGVLMEGLGLRELPAIGNAVRTDADVAVWDVSDTEPWKAVREVEVTAVEMHYDRWDDAGEALWCSWISVELGGDVIEFVLGEGDRAKACVLPSADNVAVIFERRFLPSWLTGGHE